ncbi:MAG: L-rhamnose mutarotase [Bacteroidales bacterium]|nr:L-rhamnose mutarotase [Candidatus Equimonas enterica]
MENNAYAVKQFDGPTKRLVQTLDLEDQPELIAAYRHLHSEQGVWQQVLDNIRAAGLLEMEIYLLGNRLFMIVEMPADLSWDEAMTRMARAPRQAEWEQLTARYQRAAADATSDEKWHLMERIFHLY